MGLDPNFFVTEASVTCCGNVFRGRTLYLSEPLCRILSVQELRAIIGHELGHFRGDDTSFSLKFYPIYRGTVQSIEAIAASTSAMGEGGFAVIPAAYALGFFLHCFAQAESRISRDRELAADAIASECAGERTLGVALTKVCAHSIAWQRLSSLMEDRFLKEVRIGDKTYEAKAFLGNLSNAFVSLISDPSKPVSIEKR